MDFAGEHGWVADIGQFLVSMATVFGVVALVSFYLRGKVKLEHQQGWDRLGKASILIQSISFLGVMAMVFVMLANRYYEYDYVHSHASNNMPFKYVLVAFWGGQQGSLLLWGGWQSLMTITLLFSLKYQKPRVLAFMALVQTFIAVMLLGAHIGDFKMGISPFVLLREADANMGPLWEQIPNYMQLDPTFRDGQGLNASLQNYWMLIHPPTLFLGFSLLLIPAAMASAGWSAGDRKGWVKPALPWAFTGVAILGLGILMGGAWAYESLNFGGFWAWDPVENASLIPWIFLTAGAHVMLVTRNTGKASFVSAFLIVTAYLLVIYASFLTRSGVLSETSVHSFTGEGLSEELLIMLIVVGCYAIWPLLGKGLSTLVMAGAGLVAVLFIILNGYLLEEGGEGSFVGWFMAIYLLVTFATIAVGYLKSMKQEGEEQASSKEFWMFVGAVVLVLSAVFLIYATSLPALNEAFGTKMLLYNQDERNGFYNLYMGIFAIIIALLIGFSQYMRYRSTPGGYFWKQLMIALGLGALITGLVSYYHDLFNADMALLFILTFTASFAIASNVDYWLRVMRGGVRGAGASLAHVGFSILLLGSVVSMGRQQVITRNQTEFMMAYLNDEDDPNNFSDVEDMQVFMGDTLEMGPDYYVAYSGTEFVEPYFLYCDIEYFDKRPRNYKLGDTIAAGYMLYAATVDHQAKDFIMDYQAGRWRQLNVFDGKEYYNYPHWRATAPGEKLFENRPRMILDMKQFRNNLAEPGTRHFWDYDVFTHIRYTGAILPMNVKAIQRGDTTPMQMPPQEYDIRWSEGKFPTLSYNVHLLDFRAMTPKEISENKLSRFDQGFALDLAIYAYRDFEKRQPYFTSVYHVKKENMKEAIPRHLPELGLNLRFDDWNFIEDTTDLVMPQAHSEDFENISLEQREAVMRQLDSLEQVQEMLDMAVLKVDSTSNGLQLDKDKLSFKLSVAEDEYIIMQGTVFPWINLIWLGSLMMCLGTILAVYLRWRKR